MQKFDLLGLQNIGEHNMKLKNTKMFIQRDFR